MKLEKFMCDVTKALVKGDRVAFRRCGEGRLFITVNCYFGIIIPEDVNIFRHPIISTWEIPADWNCHEIKSMLVEEVDGKRLLRVFKGEFGETRLDDKLLKYFSNDAKAYQTKENGAVYIAEGGTLCGAIMPVVKREVK